MLLQAQILSLLSSHPNVAALLQTYEDAAGAHIVLELVRSGCRWDLSVGAILSPPGFPGVGTVQLAVAAQLAAHQTKLLRCESPVLQCEGGELFERIAAKGVLTEREGALLTCCVCRGCCCTHHKPPLPCPACPLEGLSTAPCNCAAARPQKTTVCLHFSPPFALQLRTSCA